MGIFRGGGGEGWRRRMKRLHVILLTSALLGVGFLLNVLACALTWPGAPVGVSWYNLFSILFFVLAAVPPMLCARGSDDDLFEEGGGNAWPDVAFFLTGALATSGYALSGILVGARVIVWQTLVMSVCGSLVLTLAVVVMLRFVLGGNGDSEMQSW